MYTLKALSEGGGLAGKRVFIRSDLNVPMSKRGYIEEDTRIRAAIPAIHLALSSGAAVMVASHLGSPIEGLFDRANSLERVAEHLSKLLGCPVPLLKNWVDNVSVKPGGVVLLENCRFNAGEKSNDAILAKKMALLCDVYVNDAFGTAHRIQASTYGIACFAPIACAGPLLRKELRELSQILKNPRRPLLAIVGGSKISSKLPVLKSLITKVDQLVVGGGIANTLLLAKGHPIGKSLVEATHLNQAREIIRTAQERGVYLPVPKDVVCAGFQKTNTSVIKKLDKIGSYDAVLDIGPDTVQQLSKLVESAGTIIWSGPVGAFEIEAFSTGTRTIAHAIAHSSAFSVIGGGDTLAAVEKYGFSKKISYISTGGGAFLKFMEGKTLPAVDILQERYYNANEV